MNKHSNTSGNAAKLRVRLRTKTGCLTCRKRRKKCDEQLGVCIACQRNDLICIWPQDSGADLSKPSWIDICSQDQRPNDLKYTSMSAISWNSKMLSMQQRHVLFVYFTKVIVQLLHPHMHPSFTGHSYLYSLGLQHPSLMNAFLACAAMALSKQHPDLQAFALGYYSAAISSTRALLNASIFDGTEDWLMVMAVLLGIFERWQTDLSCRASLHLHRAAQLLILRRARAEGRRLGVTTPLQPLFAESVLYNVTVTTFLTSDISWSSDQIFWQQIEIFFTPSPIPGASQEENSSLIGVPLKLYRLLLQISHLARKVPLEPDNLVFAAGLQDELDMWLQQSEINSSEIATNNEGRVCCWQAARLYTLAANIVLFKAIQPGAQASNPYIRCLVLRAIDILEREHMPGFYWSQHYCWPLIILGCSVFQGIDVLILRRKMDTLWQISHFGDIKRITHILESIWTEMDESGKLSAKLGGEDICYGIDLLIRGDGLSIFLK